MTGSGGLVRLRCVAGLVDGAEPRRAAAAVVVVAITIIIVFGPAAGIGRLVGLASGHVGCLPAPCSGRHAGMSDPDQPGEELDEAVGDEDYPPNRQWGRDDLDARTEPEVWERDRADDEDVAEVELLADDAGVPDEEDQLVAEAAVNDERDAGPRADDDEFTGDETTRDFATEHVPPPAEETAVHIDEDS
jgi:hypothetical protein